VVTIAARRGKGGACQKNVKVQSGTHTRENYCRGNKVVCIEAERKRLGYRLDNEQL